MLNIDLEKDYLETIFPEEKLKLDRFDIYIPPSKDQTLLKIAQASNLKYLWLNFVLKNLYISMSTSTFSNILAQLFYVVSGFKGPYFNEVFRDFEDEPKKFMITQRKPISNFVHLLDKERMIYALDSD